MTLVAVETTWMYLGVSFFCMFNLSADILPYVTRLVWLQYQKPMLHLIF